MFLNILEQVPCPEFLNQPIKYGAHSATLPLSQLRIQEMINAGVSDLK
jgi:hypothetical protein